MTKKKTEGGESVSFYMNNNDQATLEFLLEHYKIEKTPLMRKLITEAAAVIKYKESQKEKIK
jgi:hypothetical protein